MRDVGLWVSLEPPLALGRIFSPFMFCVFSTFDTRDLDKSQPDMDCGTHVITGGTGKYAGITGKEPFKCIKLPALAGSGGYFAMDIPHNTTWEIVTGH
jgi:hypothetical protein